MGTGTDVAMNSAQSRWSRATCAASPARRLLSAATVGNMRQNLAFAFLYNALGVPIAAGVLYPSFGLVLSPIIAAAAMTTLLNVSYDVARDVYKDYNPMFQKYWKAKTGESVELKQSHGGSTKQVRAVADGLEADVVTMNQANDVEFLAEKGLVAKDWAKKFPNNASPYTSTMVFIVRKGNPKALKDWSDLAAPGIQVILPHPKNTGNGRNTYLSAWAWALKQPGGSDQGAGIRRQAAEERPAVRRRWP
jgi:ABC-type sulfate transport system substrate-binding protein